ncbi:MAG: chromate transporter [Oscillospiraceae bacterium]|nr:chromate transporter [Oscillospiraceae bacterium]
MITHRRELLKIFVSFCKVGALTFGGGYAMLPVIQREITDNRGWAEKEELVDYFAIGQCLPGIIAVNTAVLIGRKRAGPAGGAAAALGVVFPSIVIIIAIAAFISNYTHIPHVQSAFFYIRIAVAALILDVVIKLWKAGVKDVFGVCVFVIALFLSLIWRVSPVILVLFAVAAGNLASRVRGSGGKAS